MKVFTEERGAKCNECGRTSILVVQVGEEPWPNGWEETATADICLICLRKAVKLGLSTQKASRIQACKSTSIFAKS